MKTFKYLFISLATIFLLSFDALGQSSTTSQSTYSEQENEDDEPKQKKEKKYVVLKDQGLSLGIDLSPIITHFVKDERTGIAFIGRYGIKNRLFAGAEIGYENIKYNNDTYNYKSNGTFFRIGIDYDLYNSDVYPTNNNIFIGIRYAFAWQSQESNSFTIVDSYWGDYTGSIGSNSVTSHSADVLFGLRCEVVRNFYMGWSFRGRFLIASSHSDKLKPYIVAGYGKYDNRANIGFTYTLEYQIPFNKLRSKK